MLGRTDLGTSALPPLDTPVATGTMAFLEHNGPHAITPLDWQTFLDFTDRFLQPAKKQAKSGEPAARSHRSFGLQGDPAPQLTCCLTCEFYDFPPDDANSCHAGSLFDHF